MEYKEYIESKKMIAVLKKELQNIPVEQFLERGNFEWLIFQEEERLRTLDHIPEPPKTLQLIFKGKHVNGTDSINAKFAASVTSVFADIIALLKKGFTVPDGSELIIKSIVRGSFGFEFEALPGDKIVSFENNTERSFSKFQECIEHCLSDTDDDLDTFLIDVKSPVIDKMVKFFKINAKYESWFASDYLGKKISINNPEEIQKIISRISISAIEKEISIEGLFHGCLPSARKIEFISNAMVYSITLGSTIDPVQIEKILAKDSFPAKIKIKQVSRGERKPKYLLENFKDISYKNP
ncbi:MAG: hypothetical protein RBR15_05840 [Sphaerochaeta sp.]|nr:hypothetical protein [Sphaerochaeta sp.]